VQFCLRFSSINAAVRAALESALRKEKTYWMGQFRLRAAASGSDGQPPVNTIRREADADAARMPPPEAEASAPSPEESRDHGAAEPGAPLPAPIPEPGTDAALEIAPGVNMPTAEVHASTSPTPLDLLDRIHRQLSWNEVADRIRVDGIAVDRSTLLAWRDTQMGKLPKRRVSSRMAQKIADGLRYVAIELKIYRLLKKPSRRRNADETQIGLRSDLPLASIYVAPEETRINEKSKCTQDGDSAEPH
jgi:hypothetical protein